MKQHILAVCDLEEEYSFQLMEYLTIYEKIPFEIQGFSDVERLKEFAKNQKIEILLISAKAMEALEQIDAEKIILLSDGEKQMEEYPSVYKYQSSDSLIREVMTYYAQNGKNAEIGITTDREVEILGVYSPVGRCGKTSFAWTLGVEKSKKIPTIYLNLEGYSGFSKLMEEEYNTDLSDFIFFSKQREESLTYRLHSMVRRFEDLDYIPPVLSPGDLRDVTKEEWMELLEKIIRCSNYDCLIIEFSDYIDGLADLLKICKKVYMPVLMDEISCAKQEQFETFMENNGYDDVLEHTVKLQLPNEKLPIKGKQRLQQLSWSSIGEYVRQLLMEET